MSLTPHADALMQPDMLRGSCCWFMRQHFVILLRVWKWSVQEAGDGPQMVWPWKLQSSHLDSSSIFQKVLSHSPVSSFFS
eukprot:CAMPEP_0197883094 /NCGR_PEP_ID=MMETSP1439-20131203/10037_1 /TAXON_ID=66791 /ORGANISM="Gonyaulax spinifera, Strain CCMP409" /LENGTH=79 /DNA_ID=CAMNT_0043502799 /DNA_START=48 /DNA_END=283 /DNA_ORIENTATION=+